MKKNNNLAKALCEVCEPELDKLIDEVKNTEEPDFSEEYNQKIRKLLLKKVKRGSLSAAARKTAVVAAACLIVIFISVPLNYAVASPDKEAAKPYYTGMDTVNFTMRFRGGNEEKYPEFIEDDYELGYVPEGFERENKYYDGVYDCKQITTHYQRNTKFIFLLQTIRKDYGISAGINHNEVSEYTGKNGQLYVVIKSTDSCYTTVVWDNGKYVFELRANINDYDEVLKVCESMYKV